MQKKQYDIYKKHCPSHNVLQAISNKWSIMLIHLLSQKTYRFGELKRATEGISQKMLAQTLQALEKYGFVHKKTYTVLPLKVEYSLTQLGSELSQLLGALTKWTEANMSTMLQAEEGYAQASNAMGKSSSAASKFSSV